MHIHRVFTHILEKQQPDIALVSQNGSSLQTSVGQRYFAKIGSASDKDQFIGEAESLTAMYAAARGLVPKMIDCGVIDSESKERDSDLGRPYFLSEYKDIGPLSSAAAKVLGRRLATELHAHRSQDGRYGFHVPTYCGATRQDNGWFETWLECFDALIGGLVDKLRMRGRYDGLCKQANQVRER